jgi:hypothetical protein
MVAVGLEGRSTAYVHRLPRRERLLARLGLEVEELLGGRLTSARVHGGVGEEGESREGGGGSRGARNRRLRRASAAVGSGQIPATGSVIGEGR